MSTRSPHPKVPSAFETAAAPCGLPFRRWATESNRCAMRPTGIQSRLLTIERRPPWAESRAIEAHTCVPFAFQATPGPSGLALQSSIRSAAPENRTRRGILIRRPRATSSSRCVFLSRCVHWRRVGESNPRRRIENPPSWAARRTRHREPPAGVDPARCALEERALSAVGA